MGNEGRGRDKVKPNWETETYLTSSMTTTTRHFSLVFYDFITAVSAIHFSQQIHTHTHTHARTHARTHALTHTHTHRIDGTLRSSHTPSIAFRHLPPRKDVVNQYLECAFDLLCQLDTLMLLPLVST